MQVDRISSLMRSAAGAALVADVGGTNSRLAQVSADGNLHGVARYENDVFTSFNDVLRAYTATHELLEIEAISVAVAGPITSRKARLTNREWVFEPDVIAGQFDRAGISVNLVNDLAALGYALPLLNSGQVQEIKPGAVSAESQNGQALVVGLGTGFNVCLVKSGLVIEAELGHASLPEKVYSALVDTIGPYANCFSTTESLFSGAGLIKLHSSLTGGSVLTARDIVEEGPSETLLLVGRLLGLYIHDLVFQYLPLDGINFAGGVSRGLFASVARDTCLASLQDCDAFTDLVDNIPLRLIADDTAALVGLANSLRGSV